MSLHAVIAGSSGFLGTHLSSALVDRGHRVTALVRRRADGPHEAQWDPEAGAPAAALPLDLIAGADVVINLAGSPLIGNPHSARWREELRSSRIRTTRLLAEAISQAGQEGGRLPAFLAGNGISWYGDHGDQPLTEVSDSRGHALLTEVCRDWQLAATPAVEAGARVCWLRTAPVMDRQNPPLAQLRLLARAGLSARLGNGQQVMPMISLRDWVGAVVFAAEHDSLAGAVNLAAPRLPTNAEFTSALARQVHRPAFLFAPGAALKVAAGPMAPELLGSVNARPAALEQAGYLFLDPGVEEILRSGLSARS
ncbi:TIGR01777 family oxidoreductase [Nocardioides insulae]|uniref:TIGR01777 family oxidoreductase n=1 Tax=Nocardioides insulae TaxID=394734 RepID=UPI000410C6A1|nr:TIGR01777 family oxidoreductase [Nocardioides insulae]